MFCDRAMVFGIAIFIAIICQVIGNRVGCLPNCDCGQGGRKGVQQFKVLSCEKFVSTPIPPMFKTFQAKESPALLTRSSFEPMEPQHLTTMDLSNSGVERIEDGALILLTQLTVLKLSGNDISSANIQTFRGCGNLQEIHMDRNHLTTLGHGCFTRLMRLKKLYLQNNALKHLPELPPSLNTLDISYNQIGPDIGSYQFKKNILNVDLCGNPMGSLPSVCFSKTHLLSLCASDVPRVKPQVKAIQQKDSLDSSSRLSVTSLGNLTLTAENEGDVLSDDSMKLMKQMHNLRHLAIISYKIVSTEFLTEMDLDTLRLENVELVDIALSTFLDSLRKMNTLQSLDLTKSPKVAALLITNHEIWEQLNRLKYLGLRDCAISKLEGFKGHGKQIDIDVSRNPLFCDCRLAQQLRNGVRITGDDEQTICSEPSAYRGRLLSEVINELCQDDVPVEVNTKQSVGDSFEPDINEEKNQEASTESSTTENQDEAESDDTPQEEDETSKWNWPNINVDNLRQPSANLEKEEDKENKKEEDNVENAVVEEQQEGEQADVEEKIVNEEFEENNENGRQDTSFDNNNNAEEELPQDIENGAEEQPQDIENGDVAETTEEEIQNGWTDTTSEITQSNVEETQQSEDNHHDQVHFEEQGIVHVPGEHHPHHEGLEHPSEHYDELDEGEGEHEKWTAYIIVAVFISLTIVASIVFSVLFFYFRRQGHVGLEGGHGQGHYTKDAACKSAYTKSTK